MKSQAIRRSLRRVGALVLGGALLVCLCGCPIDTDAVLTETVQAALSGAVTSFTQTAQAALEAAIKSFVESLSTYLAGN